VRVRGFCPMNIVFRDGIVGKEKVRRDAVLPGKGVWELHCLVVM